MRSHAPEELDIGMMKGWAGTNKGGQTTSTERAHHRIFFLPSSLPLTNISSHASLFTQALTVNLNGTLLQPPP